MHSQQGALDASLLYFPGLCSRSDIASSLGACRSADLSPLLLQHPHDIKEGLFDVDAVLGRGLDEFAAEFPRFGLALLGGNFALDDPVALVADEHDWDGGLSGAAHAGGVEG